MSVERGGDIECEIVDVTPVLRGVIELHIKLILLFVLHFSALISPEMACMISMVYLIFSFVFNTIFNMLFIQY